MFRSLRKLCPQFMRARCDAREPRDAQWEAYRQKCDRQFKSRRSFNKSTLAELRAELHRVSVSEQDIVEAKKRSRERGRGYLFLHRVGTSCDYERAMNDLHHAHERALKARGREPRIRLYDLRHTYGTRGIEAGMDPLTLAKLRRHSDLKTTQGYVHPKADRGVSCGIGDRGCRTERHVSFGIGSNSKLEKLRSRPGEQTAQLVIMITTIDPKRQALGIRLFAFPSGSKHSVFRFSINRVLTRVPQFIYARPIR